MLSPDEREMFYKEAFRVLKPDGVLSISFQQVKNGHTLIMPAENDRLKAVGFQIWSMGTCTLASPTHD
jgi:hypothetical protein